MDFFKYVVTVLATVTWFQSQLSIAANNPADNVVPAELPLPGSLPVQDYEQILYQWLMTCQYQELNWRKDKSVRDTGPFINSLYCGTHPAES